MMSAKLSTTQATIYFLLKKHPLPYKAMNAVSTQLGAVAVDTGIFTGRSPKDKYIVRDDVTRNTVWWSDQGKGKTTTIRSARKPGNT